MHAVHELPPITTTTRDFDRLEERMVDIFARGLAGDGCGWAPHALDSSGWRSDLKVATITT